MSTLMDDLHFSLRLLRRNPGFTLIAVVALALGIGVNTAIFSVVNAVLLKPLPYSNPGTLVVVENTSHGKAYGPWTSPVRFMYWRAQKNVFSDVAAISQSPYYVNYTEGVTPEQVKAAKVSESYFRVLRVPIVRGRSFTAKEDRPGGPKVAVISYDFWQRHLGGAADVLGKSLPLNGGSYTIVGITGPHFRDLDPFFEATSSVGNADLLLPFQLDPNTTSEFKSFNNLARLKPGVTLAEAQAHVAASAAAFRQRFPTSLRKDDGFSVMRAKQAITTMYGDPRTRLWVLVGAVGFVLLIACVNVANLLLVRATGQAHEIAIRSALGAARSRIVRQLLTESLLLSLMGGLLGLLVGFLGIHALLAVSTAGLPRLGPGGSLVGMDWRVVAFTLGLSIATSLVFGLAPALLGSRSDLNTVIKNTDSRSGGFRQNKAGSVLVTVEVGLAVVLLIGAALLIRTSLALGRVDPGFNPSHVITMHTTLSASRFPTVRSLAPIIRNGLAQVRSLPGVESAAATCCAPLQGNLTLSFRVVGRPQDAGASTGIARYVTTSEDYFATLGIPLVRGRTFVAQDDAGGPAVAIINEAMAKRFWANGQDPLRDRIEVGRGSRVPERRIIGIVGDVHYGGLGKDPGPAMYVPMAQVTDPIYMLLAKAGVPKSWVVRTRGDSAALSEAIRNSIGKATGAPVVDVEPMGRALSDSVSRQRLNMLLMSIFGGAALLLAAIGIYGLLAYSVQQRVQEIGIRMALGADAGRVKGMVVRQGMILVAIGISAGVVAAFYTAHVLASWLFEVKPRDPVVFVSVPVVLALIALVAVWLPARRASGVDPLDALRYE